MSGDVFIKEKPTGLDLNTRIEDVSNSASGSQRKEIEDSCPFYFSTLHSSKKIKNVKSQKNEVESGKSGNFEP